MNAAIAGSPPTELSDALLSASLRRQPPLNLARARAVMEESNLTGIVVGDPLNVFHFTGYWPQIALTKAGHPATTFALLCRDPTQPRGLVTSHFIYYYSYCDGAFANDLAPFLFAETGDDGAERSGARSAVVLGFSDAGLAPLSAVETRRRQGVTAALQRKFIRHDAGAALVDGMRELGLWKGDIAYDDGVIATVCAHHQHPGRLLAADNLLRSIRMIKSPLELALMRRASWANVQAVHAAAQVIRPGMSYADIRAAFSAAAVARGNTPVFLTVDRVSTPLSEEVVSAGQTLFIDGVSHYQHYHGDYARTVSVGEPTAPMKQATAALSAGWDAIRERLKPGLKYSELVAIGNRAVSAAGHGMSVGFGPHSVGLSHTDEPARISGGFYAKADLSLQEHMVLSVDCPVLDTGLGGSAHIEDLMVITRDGAEALHDLTDPVIVV